MKVQYLCPNDEAARDLMMDSKYLDVFCAGWSTDPETNLPVVELDYNSKMRVRDEFLKARGIVIK